MKSPVAPSQAPADRYVVLEYLSEGGMGAIYIGKKLGAGGFEKEVVLKQLLPEFTQQEEFIDLFLREAKLSATLDHANIIHTIDLVTAGEDYFIVMEYLAGGDLRSLLRRAKRRGKRLSPSAALYITREVLAALAYAHVKRDFNGQPLKLIHRDVSPSNLLVSFAGEVKLTDFGIAKAATHTSLFYRVKGKIGYMSPEQAKSEDMDHRSDLYSAAVCMYEMLTGERLFISASMLTSADEIYSQPIPMVSRKIPGVPSDIDFILQKALSINPDERYQTAGQLGEALTRCAHRHGLLMSASELADELAVVCGPTNTWRDDDDADDDDGPRPGTALLSDDDDEEDYAMLAAPAAPVLPHAMPGFANARAARPAPSADGQFRGRELTSIINMIDDEAGSQNPNNRPANSPMATGASPLVRFDDSSPVRLPFGAPGPAAPPVVAAQRDRMASPTPLSVNARLPVPGRDDASAVVGAKADKKKGKRADAAETTQGTSKVAKAPTSRGFALRWWMVVLVVLVAGAIAAVVVGLSGPDL